MPRLMHLISHKLATWSELDMHAYRVIIMVLYIYVLLAISSVSAPALLVEGT